MDPRRCGDGCERGGCGAAACAEGPNEVALPEGSPCDGLLETRRPGGRCVLEEPLCHMARQQPCAAAGCAGAAEALRAFQRAKAAEAEVAGKRALLDHLARARQRAIDEQQSAARDAARALAGTPELETRVRQSVAALTAAHEAVLAGMPSDEARGGYKARLAAAAEAARGRLEGKVAAMRDRAQGLQSAAALVRGDAAGTDVRAALRLTGELQAQAGL